MQIYPRIKMHSSDETPSFHDIFYVRNLSCDAASSPSTSTLPDSSNQSDWKSILESLNSNVDKLKEDMSKVMEKKFVSHGVWDESLKLVKIVESKNAKQYQPHSFKNALYLYPFEALFALECRVLMISHHDIPLSIEEGYKLLLDDKHSYQLYRVFSTLSKSGYHVKICEAKQTVDSSPEKSVVQSNCKHLLEDVDELQYESKKKQKLDTINEKKNDNYKVVTSIRTLTMGHLRKLTKMDHNLRMCFKQDKNQPSKTILYNVRDSAVPIEMNKRLKHLHGDGLRPLIDFSAIHNTGQLFERMKQAGPKCSYDSLQNDSFGDPNLTINFEVYRPKTNSTSGEPIFRVAIVNEDDPLPSLIKIRTLQANHSAPLVFALVSDSLEFNFYCLESLTINDEYPILWEKYYASGESRRPQ